MTESLNYVEFMLAICGPDEVICNAVCINDGRICNGIPDCIDATDERNCPGMISEPLEYHDTLLPCRLKMKCYKSQINIDFCVTFVIKGVAVRSTTSHVWMLVKF